MSKAQQEMLEDILNECNDFRVSYITLIKEQDKAYTEQIRKYSAELVDYKLITPSRSKGDELVKLFHKKKYKYLSAQRFLLEEVLALIKDNYVNLDFKITSITLKGEYQLDKFVLLPLFGWVDPGFKIRKLKDVYFIVSKDGIQTVSKSFCYPIADSVREKIEEKYEEIRNKKGINT